MCDKKIEHLKIIQMVISRLAKNSYLIKSWSMALLAAFLIFLSKAEITSNKIVIVLLFPILFFSLLDAYYLDIERKFRDLYNKVRKIDNDKIDFDMKISSDKLGIFKAYFSFSVWFFYMIEAIFLLLMYFALCFNSI